MAAKDATSIGSNIVTGGSSHDEHNIGPAGRAPDKTGVPVGYPVVPSIPNERGLTAAPSRRDQVALHVEAFAKLISSGHGCAVVRSRAS